MDFETLDKQMRRFEQSLDRTMLEGIYVVARLDGHRNSLNSHCYWALRKDGLSASAAQKRMSGISNREKNELLFERRINSNDLPLWQKRGVGVYFQNEERKGFNPKTKEETVCVRRVLHLEEELPIGEENSRMIKEIVSEKNEIHI